MKKTTLLIALISVVLLTGCTKDKNPTTTQENKGDELNCFTLCHETIPEKCSDEIVEFEANGVDVMTNDTIYNDEFCDAQCNSWTPEVMACINSAKSCDQIGPEAEYCMTNEPESPFEYDEEKKEVSACDAACKNYSKCAGFTAGATAGDVQEAYNTCYGECQSWSEKTISCMSKQKVSNVQNCMNITACGLQEYQGLINSVPK